jgi:preprotein translocase subunit SecB
MAEEAQTGEGQAEGAAQPQLGIQRVYVKDVSLETPNTPDVFREQWKPDVNLNVGTTSRELGNDLYEVVVSVTVTARLAERTAFLVEVQQAGIFTIKGLDQEQLQQVMAIYCPNVIFPYAREAVSDLVTRAGFPQLLLAPVNFEALYARQMQQEAGAGAAETPAGP